MIRSYMKKWVCGVIVCEEMRGGEKMVIKYGKGEVIWEEC